MKDFKDWIEHENDYDDTKEIERILYPEYDSYDDDDDEGDDDDDNDDDSDDGDDSESSNSSDGLNIPLTLSFSFNEPKRTTPNTGIWKYYDESWGSWDFDKALMDKFPSLKDNYDYDYASDTFALDIMTEAYDIDHKRGLSYFEWVMDFFPAAEIQKTKGGEKYFHYCTLIFFDRILSETDEDKDFLYDYFVNNPKVLSFLLIDVKWDKHNQSLLRSFMELFEYQKDFYGSKLIYETYLKHQQDRYTDRDLSKFWDSRLIYLDCEEMEADLYDLVQWALSQLGEHGNKVRKYFSKTRREKQPSVSEIESEIIEVENEIKELLRTKDQLQKRLKKLK